MIPGKKPVILQVIPELSAGGAERTAIEIAAAIVAGNGEALVASQGGRLAPELASAGGKFIAFPAATKNPVRVLANAASLTALARRCGADLIHARSRAPAWSARFAAKRLGLPFVTTYHGVYNQTGRVKAWYNSIMAAGDIVIANSEFTANVVRERHQAPPEKLRIIHRGVDLKIFSPDAVSDARVAALRDKWLIAPHERIILQAARLTRWKGQTLLIDAALSIKDAPELANAVFVLAGDAQGRTAYEHNLRMRIEQRGLSAKFRMTGHCDDMPAAFKAAHLAIVSPLEPEAFGRVSVEAQAMACPVAAVNIGALPETLLAGETGWLLPPMDAGALGRTILESLAMEPSAFSAMRHAAAAFARAHFSIAQMQAKTLDVYDELLETRLAGAFKTQL